MNDDDSGGISHALLVIPILIDKVRKKVEKRMCEKQRRSISVQLAMHRVRGQCPSLLWPKEEEEREKHSDERDDVVDVNARQGTRKRASRRTEN